MKYVLFKEVLESQERNTCVIVVVAWVLRANQEAASTFERPIRKAKKFVSYVLHIRKRKEESYYETRPTDMHYKTRRPQCQSTLFFRQMKWALKMIDAFWRVFPIIIYQLP